ncbi:MAG: FAD-binding oxidoreductase [Dehalococcoidia bacterium]
MTTSTRVLDRAAALATVEAARRRFVGTVITADDRGYDDARLVHDHSIDRRPLAIVQVGDTQDVVLAVRLAAETGLELAVRSGAHSLAGFSTGDDVLVIDLSGLKGIAIDPIARVARVQAGATSGDLAGPAHRYGLALTTGDTSSVGIGGLATGGGIGWFVRKVGLTIDQLRSAQVVTADGRLLTASPDQHADLFWAIRGGGGNFGIITEFEFQLVEAAEVYGGALVLPATREVMRGYLDYIAQAPEELTTIAFLMHAPPAPFIPESRLGEPVLNILTCWLGDLEAGEQAIAPLRALAPAVADVVGPLPYPAMYQFMEAAAAPHSATIRTMFMQAFDDQAIDDSLEALDHATSPMSMIQFRGLGGAMARVPRDGTAFAHRDAKYLFAALALWEDPSEDRAPHQAWVDGLWGRVNRLADGAYVNFVGDEGEARVRDAYPASTMARLAEVKRRYDPDNLFHLNQNVRP